MFNHKLDKVALLEISIVSGPCKPQFRGSNPAWGCHQDSYQTEVFTSDVSQKGKKVLFEKKCVNKMINHNAPSSKPPKLYKKSSKVTVSRTVHCLPYY